MLARLITPKTSPLWSPPAVLAAAVMSLLQLSATMPRRSPESRPRLASETGYQTPVYILPILPKPNDRPRAERVQFLAIRGSGAAGPSGIGSAPRRKPAVAPHPRSTAQQEAPRPPDDSRGKVYIMPEVDRAVVRDPSSAAPEYPEFLREQGIEGLVVVKFVVDTDGLADSASLRVLASSHPAFTEALRAALPKMKFVPAAIDGRSVRQLVEQQFRFVITKVDTISASAARARNRRHERS